MRFASLMTSSMFGALLAAVVLLNAANIVSGVATLPPAGSVPSVSVPFDSRLRIWSDDLPLNHPALQPPGVPGAPEQVRLLMFSPSSLLVTWVTGQAWIGVGPVETLQDQSSDDSVVRFGTAADKLDDTAVGASLTYSYIYNFPGASNYTSGLIHRAVLVGLLPSTDYYYQVGSTFTGLWSDVFSTRTPPAVGDGRVLRLGVLGDLGQTYNSTSTVGHLVLDQPDVLIQVGDFSYADDYTTDGWEPWAHPNGTIPNPPGIQRPAIGTYQPRWDTWGRMVQPMATTIPLLPNTGNHEKERQSTGEEFVSYISRFPTPYQLSGSTSPLFYSVDVGLVHTVHITSYTHFEKGSPQYNWLQQDLMSVDRQVTPWLVATFHAPWYHTYVFHYKENECMRLEMEDLFVKYGVDVVFHGHVHSYERTHPMYDYQLDECAPVYVTIGDGGNIEGLAVQFVDEGPHTCPDPAAAQPWTQPQKCVTFQHGRYCQASQPHWSAHRDPSFGHGMLEVHNGSHAYWRWNRNQNDERVVSDSVWLVQNRDACAARRAAIGQPDAQAAMQA